MNRPRLSVLWLAWVAFPVGVFAQGRAPAPNRRPSFIEENAHFLVRSLEDDHQGFYVVWSHAVKGTYTLVGQHVDAKGAALWQLPGALLAESVKGFDAWDAFPDGAGGLVLSWVGPDGLLAQRYGPKGNTTWGHQSSLLLTTGTCQSASGVADAAGGAYFVWSEKRYADRSVLIAQHLTAQGHSLWGIDGSRVSLQPSSQRDPRVVYDGVSGAFVIWNDARADASQIQAQRLDYQGNLMWGAQGVLVTAPALEPGHRPWLEPLSHGTAVTAWIAPSSAVNRLFVQALDAKGQFFWDPNGVQVSPGRWEQWGSVLYADGEGHVWTGWEDYRDHIHWQVFIAAVNTGPSGAVSLGEAPLGPTPSDESHLTLTDSGRGGLFAAWLDNRSGYPGIYIQEVNSRLSRLMADQGQQVADQLVNPATPQLVGLGPGRVAVLIADHEQKNRWALYWTAVNGPSAPSPAPAAAPAENPEPGAEGMSYP